MRIVFVSWRELANEVSGGSELLVHRLLSGIQERGHDVALVCGGPVGRRPYQVIDAGGRYSQYLVAPVTLARRFGEWDVLFDVANGIPFFSPLWRRGPSVCVMLHSHQDQWSLHFPPPAAAAGRLLERRVVPVVYRRFVAISPSTAKELAAMGVPAERITVVEPGVEVPDRAAARPATDGPLFLMMSRLVPQKRVELALRAWARVEPRTGGRLVVIGGGDVTPKLAPMIGRGVEIRGYVDDDEKEALLGSADLLVHTAMREGWGVAIMEAAAHGVPTLAIDVAGVRDTVIDTETGVLVSDGDRLVDEWVALAGDPDRRHRLGEAARRRAMTKSWDVAVDGFLKVAADAQADDRRRLVIGRRVRRRARGWMAR